MKYKANRKEKNPCKLSFRQNSSQNSGHYSMLSCRISRNIGENMFRSYTGTTIENTDFHVLVA